MDKKRLTEGLRFEEHQKRSEDKEDPDQQKITVRIPVDVHRKLKVWAVSHDRTFSSLVVYALEELAVAIEEDRPADSSTAKRK